MRLPPFGYISLFSGSYKRYLVFMNKNRLEIQIKPKTPEDRQWVKQLLVNAWGSVKVVSRGKIYDASKLPGLIAYYQKKPLGLLTYYISDNACEILTLNSLMEGNGIGSELISSVREIAVTHHCRRLWLITTNDNLRALGFYQRRGFFISAIHYNAIAQSRKLKPQIPLYGSEGILLRDEIELEIKLT
jgi:GNAT superfamily N-acetyltransferase